MKKITISTVKSFIRKSKDLHISSWSSFDGMVDGMTESHDKKFFLVASTKKHIDATFGISGAWFVGRSRDSLIAYDDGRFRGIEVYNSCGHFILAVPYLRVVKVA